MEPLDEQYFVWLYSQVGSVDERDRSKRYLTLLRYMHRKPFIWTIAKDGNRAEAGKELRQMFLSATGTRIMARDRSWLAMDCSFLEMMIALAYKLEFDGGGTRAGWFWIMIGNLGLTECTDANPPEEIVINHVLDAVMNRDYAPNGAGGLFPLRDPTEDQRGVELWNQLEAYLLECELI